MHTPPSLEGRIARPDSGRSRGHDRTAGLRGDGNNSNKTSQGKKLATCEIPLLFMPLRMNAARGVHLHAHRDACAALDRLRAIRILETQRSCFSTEPRDRACVSDPPLRWKAGPVFI